MTAAQAKFSTTCPLGIKSYSNGKERHRSKGLWTEERKEGFGSQRGVDTGLFI